MNFRAIAGVVAGCLMWWVLFLACGIGFGLLWPAYRTAARFLFRDGDFSHFSTAMLFVNFIVFISAGLVVGWLVSLISKSRTPALVVALLYLLYTVFEHYFLLWNKLPGWYNVIAPWIISGSIVLGSRLARQRAHAMTA